MEAQHHPNASSVPGPRVLLVLPAESVCVGQWLEWCRPVHDHDRSGPDLVRDQRATQCGWQLGWVQATGMFFSFPLVVTG